MKLGTQVEWTSSAQGRALTKRGTIEQVVAPGERPCKKTFPSLYRSLSECGSPRNHESYVVRVPNESGRGAGKIYWPLANKLRSVLP